MNYKELAQQYGVLPPEEKKLYCTKCGAPKHGGESATTVGPPLWFDETDAKPAAAPVLWFDEADTKPKMEAPKSPRRNNRARWFLVSAFALLGLVIVRVAKRPTSNTEDPDTPEPASPGVMQAARGKLLQGAGNAAEGARQGIIYAGYRANEGGDRSGVRATGRRLRNSDGHFQASCRDWP